MSIVIPQTPNREEEVFEFYGWDPDRFVGSAGEVRASWEAKMIRTIALPAPMRHVIRLKDGSPLIVTTARVHYKLTEVYKSALHECHHAGPEIYTQLQPLAGFYEFRLVRGGEALSVHGLGGASDHDPAKNPMGSSLHPGICGAVLSLGKRADDPKDKAHACRLGGTNEGREVIKIFKAHGFFWGGEFRTRLDCMHLQFATGY